MTASELGLETLIGLASPPVKRKLKSFRTLGKGVFSEEVSMEFVW